MKKLLTLVTLTLLCCSLPANAQKHAKDGKVVRKPAKVTVCPKHPRKSPPTKTKANTTIDRTMPQNDAWDFLQFGIWFDTPRATRNSNVYGIKIGAPICSGYGTVKGIEAAVLCGATDNVTGLQATIITSLAKHLTGLQFSIVNYAESVNGLQLGILNMATKKSFQIGIINHIEGAAIPWLPIFNCKF